MPVDVLLFLVFPVFLANLIDALDIGGGAVDFPTQSVFGIGVIFLLYMLSAAIARTVAYYPGNSV